MMTLYGRQVVLSILEDLSVNVFRLHLAESNASSDIVNSIEKLATDRQVEIMRHSRQALSRISKNGRQDQGVAIDIQTDRYRSINDISASSQNSGSQLIGLDRITNPQNLGMIIRSVTASPMDGLLLPKKGCAKIDPLVHKASAGTLLSGNIFHCATLKDGLKRLRKADFQVIGLSGEAKAELSSIPTSSDLKLVFVLGNETEGISDEIRQLCDQLVKIPLANNVESINVAAAATLVSFRSVLAEG